MSEAKSSRVARRPRVLMVDDDAAIRRAVVRLLDQHFDVDPVEGVTAALRRLSAGARYDLLMVDLDMPEADGRETIRRIAEVAPELAARAVVLTSGPTDPDLRSEERRVGKER